MLLLLLLVSESVQQQQCTMFGRMASTLQHLQNTIVPCLKTSIAALMSCLVALSLHC